MPAIAVYQQTNLSLTYRYRSMGIHTTFNGVWRGACLAAFGPTGIHVELGSKVGAVEPRRGCEGGGTAGIFLA
nr:hypothetical protein [uncultured Pseudomonas sp.]